MKRRTFLKGIAAAVAVGMSPAFLNATRLALAEPEQALDGDITLTIRKILADDTRETIDRIAYGQIVDNGVNVMSPPYSETHRKTFMIGTGEPISEVGVGGGGVPNGYMRFTFDEPITVAEDEALEAVYEYRRS